MRKYVLESGIMLGLLAGVITGFLVDAFVYFFVFPGLTIPIVTGNPPPLMAPINWMGLLGILWWFELCVGGLPGIVFAYFHQSTDDPAPLRGGFKYGVVLPLPYVFFGVPLGRFLDLFYLMVYYVGAVALPVFLFGPFLVWMWNRNWCA
jgi:hypothetical protein